MPNQDRPTSEMRIIPRCHPAGHVCTVSDHKDGRCGHCDAGYICPECGHNGMQTIGPDPKEPKMPGHFLEHCPRCGARKWVPWIAYDVLCPKCEEEITFVVYSASFEPVTKCPKCGVVPKDEAA